MQEKREYINGNYQKCPKCSKLNRFYGIGCGFIHCSCGKIYCKYCLKEFGTEFEAFAHYRLEHHGTNETIVTQDLDEICSSVEFITIKVHHSETEKFIFLKCDTFQTLRMRTQHDPNASIGDCGSWSFENQRLENEEATLESLGVQNNSTLKFNRIMRKMTPGVTYRLNLLDGETASCRFDKIKTSKQLIKRYKKKKRNRKNLILIHEGEILKNNEKLDNYPFSKYKPYYLITKKQFKEL
ncbi:u11/u12 small nuclear ribonucleoprotein 25 kda protein [Anaeramoeba flamelloides]|uniref:U11/u12 small nuclear ribonucleoprotein 25 kDa protein n=1 Tax=Anaeramoeba flamelloides TaxID=1746091 RepID=A0ABQ8YCR8_9EUKA|nr:u11/u12 small nuclear ribonucleoprotein 25 kda protein [Anaeramoeba flamelloides]